MRAPATAVATVDPSTFSNSAEAAVTHTDIEWDVDFQTRTLSGYVQHSVEVRRDGVAELALDASHLAIEAVTVDGAGELAGGGRSAGSSSAHGRQAAGGQARRRSSLPSRAAAGAADAGGLLAARAAAAFTLSEPHPVLGSRLGVALPPGLCAGDRLAVGVRYAASPAATALQWLAPEQTAGKRHPYLFSQCQAIHARTILPCQDGPAAKFTYEAAVRAPQPLRALMSAVPLESGDAEGQAPGGELRHAPPKPDTRVWRFRQAQPISSYLLALAVGNLESRPLGPISAVWSEPEVVEAAAWEFAETPRFLEAAESLAGPYVWGRYDLLLLPPSFPYGGMENPCLTFVGPALLAGDRSMTKTVAHEIAHSWTGNLVTAASWEHLWLNEGFTRFFERKILGRLYGEPMYQLQASLGALVMQEVIQDLGVGSPLTALVPDLGGGADPDAACTLVPYEKGAYFLHYLQQAAGGPAAFDPFFRRYIEAHRDVPLASEQFRAFYCEAFAGVPAVAAIDWEAWLYAPGMPPATNTFDDSLAAGAYALAARWHTADVLGVGGGGLPGASPADIEGWTSTQLLAFVDKLAELRAMQPLHPTITRKLDALYGLDAQRNADLRTAWLQLCINAGDEAVLPGVRAFLAEQGRARYLRKLYRALARSRSAALRTAAPAVFAERRAGYHPIAERLVAQDLGLA